MECDFKAGDKITCKPDGETGSVMCARVLKINGGLMDIEVYQPKIGKLLNVTVGGWEKICKPQTRCKKAPRIEGQ